MTVISRKDAPNILQDVGECYIRGAGNSMMPIIKNGDTIHLKKVLPEQLRVGDAVYVRVGRNTFVHLIHAINGNRYVISNNFGHVNGSTSFNNIYGLAVKINDRVLISDEELENRK